MSEEKNIEATAQDTEIADIESRLETAGPISNLSDDRKPQEAQPVPPEKKEGEQAPAKEPEGKEAEGKPDESQVEKKAEPEQDANKLMDGWDKPDFQPQNKDWAALRRVLKAKEEQLAQIESRLRSQPEAPEKKNDADGGEKDSGARKMPPEQVFDLYEKASRGAIENADSVEAAARKVVSEMSVAEIRAVAQKAANGLFGSRSPQILDLAKSEMPIAIARELDETKEEEEEKAKSDSFRNTVAASMGKMLEKRPELKDANSEMFKFAATYRDRMIGKFGEDGSVLSKGPLFDFVASSPDWPEHIVPLMAEAFELQTLRSKVAGADALRKKVDAQRSPEPGGRGVVSRQPETEIDQIEQRLAQAGRITL